MNFLFLFASILCYSLINAAPCAVLPSPTDTINPPALDTSTSGFSSNLLTIGLLWGTSATRTAPVAEFGPLCPATVVDFAATADDCVLSKTVTYNFQTLTSVCGWASLSIGTNLTYGGNLTLTATEDYVDLRGTTQTRSLSYTLQLSVTFPAFATSETNVEIFSAVLLDVFVTSQIYVTATNNATIVFNTVVGYPFKVIIVNAAGVAPSNTNPAGFTTDLYSIGTPTFGSVNGSLSTQTWELVITPAVGACLFSGNYSLLPAMQIVCALADPADCPALNDDIVNVTLSIRSESFCVQIATYVPIVATLSSFADLANNVVATQFLVDDNSVQTSYFKMLVTSTAVTVTNINIQTIILESDVFIFNSGSTSSFTLYSNGVWNAAVNGFISTGTGTNLGTQTFNFDVVGNLFSVVTDRSAIIIVAVNGTVSYQGATKKRSIVSYFNLDGSQATQATQTSSTSTTLLVTSDGIKTQLSLAVFFVVFFFFL